MKDTVQPHKIRLYKDSDYEKLACWWGIQGEPIPSKDLIPLDSTFILSANGIDLLSISIFLTNVKGMCFLENFVGNPNYKKERKLCSRALVDHAVDFAKNKGYTRVVCFSYKDKVGERYKDLGL
jgi:hypothetical protein